MISCTPAGLRIGIITSTKLNSDWCAVVDNSAVWSSPISASTPPCLRGAGKVGVTEGIARAVDAGPFAVPDAENAVVFALAAQLGLLGPPKRGGGQVLVDRGLEQDVARGEMRHGTLKLVVEPAERGAAIAGDVARGVEAGPAVALVLHHRQAHQRLIAGDEHAALVQVEFVVERDVIERHRARPPGRQCAPAPSIPPGVRNHAQEI